MSQFEFRLDNSHVPFGADLARDRKQSCLSMVESSRPASREWARGTVCDFLEVKEGMNAS